jgi:hypothetical protein
MLSPAPPHCGAQGALQKLHAQEWFLPPNYGTRTARLVEIEDKIEVVLQDWFMSL